MGDKYVQKEKFSVTVYAHLNALKDISPLPPVECWLEETKSKLVHMIINIVYGGRGGKNFDNSKCHSVILPINFVKSVLQLITFRIVGACSFYGGRNKRFYPDNNAQSTGETRLTQSRYGRSQRCYSRELSLGMTLILLASIETRERPTRVSGSHEFQVFENQHEATQVVNIQL